MPWNVPGSLKKNYHSRALDVPDSHTIRLIIQAIAVLGVGETAERTRSVQVLGGRALIGNEPGLGKSTGQRAGKELLRWSGRYISCDLWGRNN